MSDPSHQPTHATQRIDVRNARSKLTFFKVMALIVGVGLLVLVAEMVLWYGFDNDALKWWPQPHGVIFIVYVIATALLGFAVRWSLGRMVLVMLAGCVPFLSFWVERKVAADVEQQLAVLETDQAGDPMQDPR
jgi:integral membrane protein